MNLFAPSLLSLILLPLFLLGSQALAPLEPENGVWFGVNMDNLIMQQEYPIEYGVNPVTFGTFIQIPMRAEDVLYLGEFLDQVAVRQGIALVTLEPAGGLDQVSENAVQQLAEMLRSYAMKGVSFLIRFAHEMNGSWYSWSQQPSLHKAKFRLTASILHAAIPNRLAMLWAPNNGAGYPFTGGLYTCTSPSTCSDFGALDTNKDGKIDQYDDMYEPYYPGDDAVDWVGMTLYHWGSTFPWGNNTVAEPRSFYNKLTGQYTGIQGDQTMVPDFYGAYCVDGVHNKPMAIPETAALFNVNSSCCVSELEVKKSWWKQVFNVQGDTETAVDVRLHLPKLKMINWFDIKKPESEISNQIADWTFSNNEKIRSEFVDILNEPASDGEQYWMQLESYHEYLKGLPGPPVETRGVKTI